MMSDRNFEINGDTVQAPVVVPNPAEDEREDTVETEDKCISGMENFEEKYLKARAELSAMQMRHEAVFGDQMIDPQDETDDGF
jgi:hypothetical protein